MKRSCFAASLAAMVLTMSGLNAPPALADTPASPEASSNITNITINNINESAGLELGTDARARGNGSIATGTNSLAIGKNAVATGGNENKDTILTKLNENKQKLAEIATAKENTNRLLDELQTIRKTEADVIEAGIRVEQVRKSKATAYDTWQSKLSTYNQAVTDSAAALKDAQDKINDLNSRLTGVSQLTNVDISSDEGLTNAATQLKSIAEQGTTLNLPVTFYKDYVQSYYQALGDLRQNNIILSKTSSSVFGWLTTLGTYDYTSNIDTPVNTYEDLNDLNNLKYGISSSHESNSDDVTFYVSNNSFGIVVPGITNRGDFTFKHISTDISSLSEWQSVQTWVPKLKEYFKNFFNTTNDPFMTESLKSAITDKIDAKLDVWEKAYEVTYYQGQYEATHNTIWLDKKALAQKEYDSLYTKYTQLVNPVDIKSSIINEWKKENITDIEERNKVTTDTLTSELSKALNINKDAIQQIEANLAKLKQTADQAKSTYDNTNPSDADIALSQRYEEVMRQLTEKSNQLKSEQDRLKALQDALTLHDLTNTGQNAIAVGTNALSTGTNAIALGTDTIVVGENAIALGKGSVVTGTNSIAIGVGHNVLGNNSGAFGDPDYIYGDGSYSFGNNNTIGDPNKVHQVGNNTFVLGSNVTTTANNAVILGAGSTGADNTVSIGAKGSERKVINMAAGTISATSTDAVNGSQIHDILQNGTNVNVANWKTLLGVGSSQNLEYITFDNSIITRDYIPDNNHQAEKNSISIGKSAQAEDYHNIALGYRAHANDRDSMALGSDSSALGYISLAVGTQAEANARYSTAIGNSSVAKGAESVALGQGAKSMGFNSIAIGNNSIAKDTNEVSLGHDADPALNSSALNRKLTHLADGEIAENSKDGINGGQLFTELSKKANVDASNIDTAKFAEKLGTGKVETGNTNLVTGGTVATALETKANTNLSNITDGGKTIIKNLAKGSVKVVAGTNTTVTTGTDGDATTYAVNVSSDAIKGAVKADLDKKADANATNITGTNKTAWQNALGDGKAQAGNKGLITGDTLNTALSTKADKTDLTNLTNTVNTKANTTDVNAALAKKANTDASNIDTAKFTEKLGTGKVETGNTNLVTGGTVATALENKANTDLSNITDGGKTIIKNLAKGSVKVVAGTNTTVTTGTDGDATTYAVNVSADDIKEVMTTDMAKKADANAGNITGDNKTAWQNALGDGKAQAGNIGLITGDTLNTALSTKADKSSMDTALADKANVDASNINVTKFTEKLGTGKVETGNTNLVTGGTVATALETKANTNLSNLTSDGQTIIKNLAKNSVKVVAGTNTTVTTGTDGDATTYAVNVSSDAIKGAVKADLDKKADANATNITGDNKTAWQNVLGDGKVEAGNKGLITGDTLNTALSTKADKTEITNVLDSKANITDVDAALAKKANIDASNINTAKFAEKLGTGKIIAGNTNLVTGGTVATALENKANTDLSNITDGGKTIIKNLAKGSVKVVAGTNTTVTTGTDGDATTYAVNVSNDDIKAAMKNDMDKKANVDASNLTANDVASWTTVLGTGKIADGNTNLVTGGTVYNVVKNVSDSILVHSDGNTVTIDPTGSASTITISHITADGQVQGRALTGIVSNPNDPYSAVNIGTLNSYAGGLSNQMNRMNQKLTKDIKQAGAAAAALAGLHPLPYDPSNKLNFAVAQGRYRGANATALGAFYQPNEDISFNIAGTMGNGDSAYNVGVSFKVGPGNSAKRPVKQSELDALKAQNKALTDKLDALMKEVDEMKVAKLGLSPARKSFPDVPKDHWANEAVETLAGNDVIEGYPDGEFKGDKQMTRYEYAQMLYKAEKKID